MLIERDRYSDNGAVRADVWEQIRALENRAQTIFIDYVRVSGEVVGEDYSTRLVPGNQLEEDLRPYVGEENECYVREHVTKYDAVTSVHDLVDGRGVQRQKPLDGSETEYYELGERHKCFIGFPLLEEIFKPGAYPELAELAIVSMPELVVPDDLSARIMTAEEYKRSSARARLSQFTVAHLVHVLEVYSNIAYAESANNLRHMRDEELKELHQSLQQGTSVGLRTGTKYLDCAKHQLAADQHDDMLSTWMYMNYDIQVGPVTLHFRGDIDMAIEFGEQASSYFDEQGITAKPRNS